MKVKDLIAALLKSDQEGDVAVSILFTKGGTYGVIEVGGCEVARIDDDYKPRPLKGVLRG